MKRNILLLALLAAAPCMPCGLAQTSGSEAQPADSLSPSADSEYTTGKNLLHGLGVEKNPAAALEHFKKAAELGSVEAPGAIGYFYSAGLVVEKDDIQAAEWFQKGADKGSAVAKFNLGRFYLDQKGGLSGYDKGIALMEEAASGGLPEAHAALGEIFYLGLYKDSTPDYAKAAPYVEAAARDGNVAAINMLGVMKQKGLGMTQDLEAAQECFRKAASKGDFKAQSNLGHLLDPQSKNRKRRIEAVAWLIVAASQGEPLATREIENLEQTLSKKDFSAARDKADEIQKTIATGGGAGR